MPNTHGLARGASLSNPHLVRLTMKMSVQVYWSFRSPYSYIILPRLLQFRETHDVGIDLRIVHPAAIRNPAYFARMDPLARPYFLKDTARAAAYHGLPFRRPVPDPISQDPVTLAIADQQPLARLLSRLGIAACIKGRGLEFADEAARLLWDGSVNGWNEGHHLTDAAERAGLELSELETLVMHDPTQFERQLAANDSALRASGHWGVPTVVFEDEPFFGQDRFDMLVWRMRQRGLTERS